MVSRNIFEGRESLEIDAEDERIVWTVPEDTEQAIFEFNEEVIVSHIVNRVCKAVDEEIDGWFGIVGLLYESGGKEWGVSLESLGVELDDFEDVE